MGLHGTVGAVCGDCMAVLGAPTTLENRTDTPPYDPHSLVSNNRATYVWDEHRGGRARRALPVRPGELEEGDFPKAHVTLTSEG